MRGHRDPDGYGRKLVGGGWVRRRGQKSSCRAVGAWDQPPPYVRGSRITRLAAITTTHHPKGCEDTAPGSCQYRNASKPTTGRRRGLGATARHATAKRGHEGRLMVIRLSQI